jgi:CBS domain-containing protein
VDKRSQPFTDGPRRREFHYIGYSVLFLAAGIGAVWFVHSVLEVDGDAILVAVLVVPLLLYLTLSGRVSEIAAGSLSVKLSEVSREPVSQIATEYVTADLGPRSDPNLPILKTDPNRVQVVTLQHGGHYERDEVLGRLKSLAAISPVAFLIVLDDRERVVAYMTYRSALDVLERKERGDLFIELVNGGDPDAFDGGGGFSAVKTEVLSSNATNAEALATMEETGLDALVVVDRKGRFQGIVERDRVLSRMMLALVSPPSAM